MFRVSFRCFGGSGGFGGFVSMVLFRCFGFQYMPPGLYLQSVSTFDNLKISPKKSQD